MTGREKMRAAFTKAGTDEIPVVICYENIFYRDHWSEVTSLPWWYMYESDVGRQAAWREEAFPKIGQDWFLLTRGYARESRKNLTLEGGEREAIRVNAVTGAKDVIVRPEVSGNANFPWNRREKADTPEDIDKLIHLSDERDAEILKTDGSRDLAERLMDGVGAGDYPHMHVAAPLYACEALWGFEGFMLRLADDPALVHYACDRFCERNRRSLASCAALGAEGIWIEECLIDMISPAMYEELNLPYMQWLVDDTRAVGMKSVYYYCGNPAGKMDLILHCGADAVSLEEGKKGFVIDIEDVVDAVRGRCAVYGNLDAMWLLPFCSEDELRREVARQIAAGRRNGSRFVMSLGSPVTPGTPVARVRQYCDIARELGRG